MLFYTEKKRYKNIKLVDKDAKDICKFENYEFETKDAKLIKLLKDKNKYPFIYWNEEEKKAPNKEEKKEKEPEKNN